MLRVHDAELEELDHAAAVLLGGATGGARAARAAGASAAARPNRSGLAKVRHSPKGRRRLTDDTPRATPATPDGTSNRRGRDDSSTVN